jgi:translocator protein
MKMRALLGFLAAVIFAGAIGASFSPGAWYAALAKPWWNPPGWVFGPVWTVLYLCIAIAGYRVWRVRSVDSIQTQARATALALWALQLVLNAVWSALFFGAKRPGFALVEICAMLLAIATFIVVARRVDRIAARLFLPYAAWVSFAAFLNATLWRLNSR